MRLGEKKQLSEKQKEIIVYGSLALLGLFVFLFLGSGEPVLFDDSDSYMRIRRIEGVMPVYPLFLLLNQYIFGDDKYLQIVIVEQAVLAVASILLFIRVIKSRFALRYWEMYLCFFLCLLPFTTEMPDSMATQQILTEGLAYAMFYLFMIFLLQAVWNKRFSWLIGACGMAFLLAMLRSQLQILFGVCGVIFLYLAWSVCKTPAKRLIGLTIGIAGCLLIGGAGIRIVSGAAEGYNRFITDNMTVNSFIMRIQDPEYYKKFSRTENGAVKDREEIEAAIQAKQEENYAEQPAINNSQYTSLIFSRGMYEADDEDIELFTDEMLKGLYEPLYEAVDHEQQRYAYEKRGLWMWQDIVGGIGRIGKTCLPVGVRYYRDYYPELYESDSFNEIWNHNLQTIGMELLREHMGRFLYHTLMLLPQAFICTVFFQIKQIYLLCHLITLFLYLSAAGLMVWGYADSKINNEYAEFMAIVLGTNIVMILLISVVFFGQQRYLVYNFGIFYVAYYLLVSQLWKIYGKNWIKKWTDRKES